MSNDRLKQKGPPRVQPKQRLRLLPPACRYSDKHEDQERRGQLTPLGVLLLVELWIVKNEDKLRGCDALYTEAVREVRRCLKTETPDALKEIDRAEKRLRNPQGWPESTKARAARGKARKLGIYDDDIPF